MKTATSIVFTGDIGFDRYMEKKWEDESLLSPEILDFFHSADHVVANVEGALIHATDDGSKDIFFHAMDPAATVFLKKIQADIFCLANNHTMDAGRAGIESTNRIAAEMGCMTVGAGLDIEEASAPLYLDEAGGIGIIAVGYPPDCIGATEEKPGVFLWNYMERIEKRIREIKAKCRWCIVISHGGEEFSALPNPYTRDRYLKYVEYGADIVVGHHPHVPENYEILEEGKKAIFYSLGNFIFDTDYQRSHAYTDIGLLLRLSLEEEKFSFEAIGARLTRGEQRISLSPLPAIFANVSAKEYETLIPLAAKAFVLEESRRRIFLEPEKYKNAKKEEWEAYFKKQTEDDLPHGVMNFDVVCPLAERAEDGKWQESKLDGVKDYLLSLL
ncbi:MAG: CapA family protein [Clostridia bacterium]|nr:CapA family protein [Clostridia bacterium]